MTPVIQNLKFPDRIPRGGRLEVRESAGSISLVQSDVAQVIERGRKTRADFKFFLELVNRLRILSALPIHETEIEIIEPTQINACGIRGCGGWGYYYMNLTKALISLYRKETPGIIL